MNQELFYLAPMIGITDASYRNAFMDVFGGFDFAIAPFVRTMQGQRYKESHFRDLLIKHPNLTVYPQILSNNSEDFIHLAKCMQEIGYAKINLNLGCPIPSASGKGRGAGLIPEVDLVDKLLNDFYSQCKIELSIKTRIGLNFEDELQKLIPVFNRYPLFEITIHPRTAKQKYSGDVNLEQFRFCSSQLKMPVIYSGDINKLDDFLLRKKQFPHINRWMLGRGILQDPLLLQKLKMQTVVQQEKIILFFSKLIENYKSKNYDDRVIMTRIQPHLVYLAQGYNLDKKYIRKILKAKNLAGFLESLSDLFIK